GRVGGGGRGCPPKRGGHQGAAVPQRVPAAARRRRTCRAGGGGRDRAAAQGVAEAAGGPAQGTGKTARVVGAEEDGVRRGGGAARDPGAVAETALRSRHHR